VGVVFGGLAIAGVLAYDRAYTGHWLVSPYAAAAGTHAPPELSFNPVAIWHGIARYGPYMLMETLLGSFPFLHLLAAYAVIRERDHRGEVFILAALYVGLVFAYLFHPDGYAVFFGERFHFESFFALALLAARGVQLLVERWQIRRAGVVFSLLMFGILQIGQLAFAVHAISKQGEPYRKVRTAVESLSSPSLVLLHDSPGFVAKHFNLNAADWRHSPRVFLVDAEVENRAEWACRYGFSQWIVVSYDSRTQRAVLDPGHAACSPSAAPLQ